MEVLGSELQLHPLATSVAVSGEGRLDGLALALLR